MAISRDISKKQRIRYKVKGNSGEPLSLPPYGYMKNPDNPKFWVIDPEAAEIVRRIYRMNLDGKGTEQIAETLSNDRILTPIYYWQSKGVSRPHRPHNREPHQWHNSTITEILSRREYVGDVVNFKTYSKSYKNKKMMLNKPENMFSGLLTCADCNSNLHFHFNQGNHDITYFNCSNYKGNRGTCPTTHYIRVDFLQEVILQEIHRLTKFAIKYEDKFAELVMGHSQQADTAQRERKQKELYAMTARDREIDKLYNSMFEANASGKIDDLRFAKMSSQYTAEQMELAENIKPLSAELDRQDGKAMTADMFISTVRKYTRAKNLTERMLNELIERIEVNQCEKVDGVISQNVVIHYHCIGAFDVPDWDSIPDFDIYVEPRKGVVMNYIPTEKAG
jgi:hypothetical protein